MEETAWRGFGRHGAKESQKRAGNPSPTHARQNCEQTSDTTWPKLLKNIRENRQISPRFATRAACYRIEKRGNPENGWGGCWEECCENSGCWRECWRGGVSLERNEEQHPRQHSRQQPEFSQHSSQHPPQPFSGFPRFSIL